MIDRHVLYSCKKAPTATSKQKRSVLCRCIKPGDNASLAIIGPSTWPTACSLQLRVSSETKAELQTTSNLIGLQSWLAGPTCNSRSEVINRHFCADRHDWCRLLLPLLVQHSSLPMSPNLETAQAALLSSFCCKKHQSIP
jgi:hypothetical protein